MEITKTQISTFTIIGALGWILSISQFINTKTTDLEVKGFKEEAREWKEVAQNANLALLNAKANNESNEMLIPKGTIFESSDGGKTLKINRFPSE